MFTIVTILHLVLNKLTIVTFVRVDNLFFKKNQAKKKPPGANERKGGVPDFVHHLWKVVYGVKMVL